MIRQLPLLIICLAIALMVGTVSADSWVNTSGCWTATDGLYTLVMWNFTTTSTWSVPANVSSLEYLIIAGGGGGGSRMGGGGGAGGILNGTMTVTAGAVLPVSVGAGGAGSTSSGGLVTANAAKGTNSTFNTTTANGGGFGASRSTLNAGSGGSGGGGSSYPGYTYMGNGTAGQGNDGGLGANTATGYPGGGGGGKNASGSTATGTVAGVGGAGLTYYINGTPFDAGGGGGGGTTAGTAGTATHGGGAGRTGSNLNGYSGTPNTGGGGGGGSEAPTANTGGAGGSGLVIIKYLTPGATPPIANFTASAYSGYSPLNVTFTDTSVTNITAWDWLARNTTPGNDTVFTFATTQNPSHIFSVGNWLISLNVTNASGWNIATNHAWINVTDPSLTANFTCSPLALTTVDTLSCVDSSVESGATITNWSWTFEDSIPQYATTQNAAIVYTSDGIWDVTLGVYNATAGWNNLTRSNYVTVSASGGLSGFNQQDILMDQIYTFIITIKDATTLAGIPGATVLTSNGDNTTTDMFGVATITSNYTTLVVTAGATGYYSRSISYVVDRDRAETIYLTALTAAVNTTANTNIVYIPKQIEIVVVSYNPAGVVVRNASVTLAAIANSLQADSQLETLYGINPLAANELMNGTLVMDGYTDGSGGIVFTILQSINYRATVVDPRDGVSYVAYLYPGMDPYTLWIGNNPITNATPSSQSYINRTRLFVTQPDAGNITDNLLYQDTSGRTTRVDFIVKHAKNLTIAYQDNRTGFGTSAVAMNYTHTNIRGQGYFYGYNATRV